MRRRQVIPIDWYCSLTLVALEIVMTRYPNLKDKICVKQNDQ
jgi:hypothetical protein